MPTVPPAVIVMLVIVLAAMALRWWLSDERRIKGALRSAERVAIAQYPVGSLRRIVGRVTLDQGELIAPLSRRRCAAYEVFVDEASGPKNRSWRTIIHETKAVPFTISDGTGQAWIHPEGAEFAINDDERSKSGLLVDPSAEQRTFLQRHGEKTTGWFLERTLRYREGVIEPQESVAVMGYGTRSTPGPDGARSLEFRATPSIPLYISDDTRAAS